MTTALTVTAAPMIELPESIVCAYASKDEVKGFITTHLSEISDEQLLIAAYAYHRATYRDGDSLTVKALAILAETTVEKIQHYILKLFRSEVKSVSSDMVLTNNQCSAVMSAMMDM